MPSDLLEQLGIYPAGDGSGEGTGSVRSRGLAPGTELPPAGPPGGGQGNYPPGAPESHTAIEVAIQPPAPTPAFGKIAQPDASYVPAGPAPFLCGSCVFYLSSVSDGPGRCQLVDGDIDWKASCRFFKPIPPQAGMVTPQSEVSTEPASDSGEGAGGWEAMPEPQAEPDFPAEGWGEG